MSLEINEDQSFIIEARTILETERQDPRLPERLQSMSAYKPRNENLKETLDTLLQHGLVIEDEVMSAASLAGLMVAMLNRDRETYFKLNWETNTVNIPSSCSLLIRFLSEKLGVTVVMLSTRSRTRVFAPSTTSRLHIGLLHVQNSYDEISLFSPLVCSATTPTLPPVASLAHRLAVVPPHQLSETPQEGDGPAFPPTIPHAVYRETRRERQPRSLPSIVDVEISIQTLRGVW